MKTRSPENARLDSSEKLRSGPSSNGNSPAVIGMKMQNNTAGAAAPQLQDQAMNTSCLHPGTFANPKYIQQVNAPGGMASPVAGTGIGRLARAPRTVEGFFHRKASH